MDHLPPVVNPWNPILVPHLGGVYQGGSFVDYPREQGWDIEQLQNGSISPEQVDDAACFVQEWLFFGMLETVLHMDVEPKDFLEIVHDEHGEPAIMRLTTGSLLRYMDTWKSWLENIRQPESTELFINYQAEVAACIRVSYKTWSEFRNFALVAAGSNSIETGQAVELAICVLGATLEHALLQQHVILTNTLSWKRAKTPFLVRRMMDAGWCPSIIEDIRSPVNNSALYFASLLGPPIQPRYWNDAPIRHTECSPDKPECQRRLATSVSYQTAHCIQNCQCVFVGPLRQSLRDIIGTRDPYCTRQAQLGSIPLVYWDEISDTLHTVEYSPDKQYTAISHVWSDGLGNDKENKLPVCQVRRITEYIKGLPWTRVSIQTDIAVNDQVWRPIDQVVGPAYDTEELQKQPLYFWLDTLCVPNDDTDIGPMGISLRKLAISSMRAIYARANRVLVLDEDLLQANSIPSVVVPSREESLMRVLVSTWSHRLWTLQEGVLAKAVYYAIGNRFVNFGDEDQDAEPDTDWNNMIAHYAEARDMRGYARLQSVTSIEVFGETWKTTTVWLSLRRRSVMKPSDIPICVCTLLDMDLLSLMSVSAEERLAKHWEMYTFLPAGILMLPARKHTKVGIRWAPLDMRDCASTPSPLNSPLVRLSAGAYFAMLPGIYIGKVEAGQSNGRRTLIPIIFDEITWYVRQDPQRGNMDWSDIDFGKLEDIAVLIGDEVTVNNQLPWEAYPAALVHVRSTAADGSIDVEWLRTSTMVRKGSSFDRAWRCNSAEVDERTFPALAATKTPRNQGWLVS